MSNPNEVQRLTESIDRLNSDSLSHYQSISDVYKRNKKLLCAVTVGLVLDILLSIFLAVGYSKIDHVQYRLDYTQTVTRKQVLCPLYNILLGAKNAKSRMAYPRGPAAYDLVFSQLQNSYDILDCNGE